MSLDVTNSLLAIADASAAVLSVLGAFVLLQVSVYGMKRVYALLAGPSDAQFSDDDFGPPDDFLDTVPSSSDGLEPHYLSDSEYQKNYPDSPALDVDPGSFGVTCTECGWDGVASDAVADNDWSCPACGSSQLE